MNPLALGVLAFLLLMGGGKAKAKEKARAKKKKKKVRGGEEEKAAAAAAVKVVREMSPFTKKQKAAARRIVALHKKGFTQKRVSKVVKGLQRTMGEPLWFKGKRWADGRLGWRTLKRAREILKS